ncbi:FAD-dependent oxidoreductase [Saxibacter everestensis]|uniref:FAD-dependent oxidoreductase n=1 Tax=Saxibacter everestensis TaxID=2909229 RepID=A0ABY8QYD9_9MICO|nr:FAD-dependent oxidoreductase [Brevibacteriaceae bacterium ZFBP1038]
MSAKVLIVGGGILGSMHAFHAVQSGHTVVQLEREADARGASVRNFGLVWVSGRATGADLELSLRARELWERVAESVPGTGFRPNGSLTVVTDPAELAVLEQVCARSDAGLRGFELLDAEGVREHNPAVRGDVLAGMLCRQDAAVEPRLVPRAIRAELEKSGRYEFHAGVEIAAVDDVPSGVLLRDSTGKTWSADQAIVCTGAWHNGVAAPWLRDVETVPVRRVRLHMMQTESLGETLTTSVADADSLRYYPGFDVPALSVMPAQEPSARQWGMQLLMVQRNNGGLTIGDTHMYDEPFGFDVEERPYELLARKAERVLGHRIPRIERRWTGVYSQLAPGVGDSVSGAVGQGIYYHREVVPDVRLVTGPGGRGMTHSPAIAEQTFKAAGLL